MQFNRKELGNLFTASLKEWNIKDPFRQSAVIAYYAVFSLPGLLVLIIAVAGYFFGRDAVNQSILSQVSATMGSNTADQIKEMLDQANQSKTGITGTIIGFIILLIGATGVFVELQKSLNIIW